MFFFIDDDGRDFGRCQRTDHELRRIGRPQHDVDVFAADLVTDGGDARTAQANAGTDRIDPRVVGLDGDLGAQTGVAGTGLQFHQAVGNLRHFHLEQANDEFRRSARQDDLRTARIAIDAQQVSADAVADPQVFLGNHLVARQQRLDLAGLNDGIAAFHALDRAVNDVFLALQEVGQNLLAFGVANFLQDHLLGGLGTDTAEVDGLQRLFQGIAGLDLGIVLLCLGQRHFEEFIDVLVVGHDLPATEGLEVTGIVVDRDAHIGLVMDTLLGRGCERQLKGTENDVLADVLFAGQGIDQQQNFTAHGLKPPGPSVESRHQTCLFDIIEFEFHSILFEAQANLAILAAKQFALEIAAAALRDAQLDLDVLAGEALEILRLLDDAIEARRGDFETVVIDILDLENTRQLIRHLGAVLDIDTVFLAQRIDEDANGPAARRHLDIDEFITQTDHGRFKQRV